MVRTERRLRLPKACRQILRYLVENPQAGDTADGIVWWLMQQLLTEAQETVQFALDQLVAREWILSARAGDARLHYRLNEGKSQEIQKFLEGAKRR